MAMQKKCWEPLGWVRGERLSAKEGNQSHAFLARKTTDPEGEYSFILKSLKRQEAPDRRAMFFVETSAMRALDHPGVLPVEATNSEAYKEQVELFLIAPKAAGADLDELVARGLSFPDAVRIVLGVLDILAHCHGRGVIHRDVKPCHVIVSKELSMPTLIDFGLAHSASIRPADAETEPGHGKGNRFLVGPEHLPGIAIANRSGSTDICQCVGLLFFAVTGRYPGILRDENDHKPHQRSGIQILPAVEQWKREALDLIFDKAFEWHPDKRWSSAEDLGERLRQLLQQEISPDEALRLRAARTVQESQVESKVDRLARATEMSKHFFQVVDRVITAIQEETRSYLQVDPSEHFLNPRPSSVDNVLSRRTVNFRRRYGQPGVTSVTVATVLKASELVAVLRPYNGASKIFEGNRPIELGRGTIGDRECLNDWRSCLENNLLALVDEILAV